LILWQASEAAVRCLVNSLYNGFESQVNFFDTPGKIKNPRVLAANWLVIDVVWPYAWRPPLKRHCPASNALDRQGMVTVLGGGRAPSSGSGWTVPVGRAPLSEADPGIEIAFDY
jgi:hypothetical protein